MSCIPSTIVIRTRRFRSRTVTVPCDDLEKLATLRNSSAAHRLRLGTPPCNGNRIFRKRPRDSSTPQPSWVTAAEMRKTSQSNADVKMNKVIMPRLRLILFTSGWYIADVVQLLLSMPDGFKSVQNNFLIPLIYFCGLKRRR